MRYQVKFLFGGQTKFGVVESYTDEAKAAASEGCLIVEDAVLPKRYKVKDAVDVPWAEFYGHVRREHEAAEKASASERGLHVGSLFGTPVGDGTAWYVVTKVNKKTVRIEWRGFCPDRYVDMHFGYGGSYPRDMVERFVHVQELP